MSFKKCATSLIIRKKSKLIKLKWLKQVKSDLSKLIFQENQYKEIWYIFYNEFRIPSLKFQELAKIRSFWWSKSSKCIKLYMKNYGQ